MSSTVTIEVPLAENETVFLLHVVRAALTAYRNHHNRTDHVHDKELAQDSASDNGKFSQPTSSMG
jgi:hypothetical protein